MIIVKPVKKQKIIAVMIAGITLSISWPTIHQEVRCSVIEAYYLAVYLAANENQYYGLYANGHPKPFATISPLCKGEHVDYYI